MRKNLGALLAWAVTIAVLVYLFWTIPLNEVLEAVQDVRPWSVPAMVVIVLLSYLADSFAILKTFGWFVAKLDYREVLLVRGMTYILALVNYSVGQGAIVYFVNRHRQVPVSRGTAAVLLVMGTNLLVLLVLASLGLLVTDDLPGQLRWIILGTYGGLAGYVGTVVWKPRWLAARPVLDVLFSAGLGGHLKAMAVRLPHILVLVVFSLVSMSAFGVAIPLGEAIFYLPIVYFVAVLPVSFQGLGTSQALLVHFFSPFATGGTEDARKAAVLAASLFSQVLATAIQVVIGLACVRSKLARGLEQPQPSSPATHA
jgi:hypothetical protein